MATVDLDDYICADKGLMFPVINEYTWETWARGVVYFLGMMWCFLGVAIVSDSFMCGIEHITSKTRHIQMADAKGEGMKTIEVKVCQHAS